MNLPPSSGRKLTTHHTAMTHYVPFCKTCNDKTACYGRNQLGGYFACRECDSRVVLEQERRAC